MPGHAKRRATRLDLQNVERERKVAGRSKARLKRGERVGDGRPWLRNRQGSVTEEAEPGRGIERSLRCGEAVTMPRL